MKKIIASGLLFAAVLALIVFIADKSEAKFQPIRNTARAAVRVVQRFNEVRPHLPARAVCAFVNRDFRPIQRTVWRVRGRVIESRAVHVEQKNSEVLLPRPRVQIVIYSDSSRCSPCRALIEKLRQRLTVGAEPHNQVQVVEYASQPGEFEKRGIKQTPTVALLIDGDEIPVASHDPEAVERLYAAMVEQLWR